MVPDTLEQKVLEAQAEAFVRVYGGTVASGEPPAEAMISEMNRLHKVMNKLAMEQLWADTGVRHTRCGDKLVFRTVPIHQAAKRFTPSTLRHQDSTRFH